MFSKLPPLRNVSTDAAFQPMIRAFQLHHSTVSNSAYISVPEKRANQYHCIFHYTVRGHGEVIHKGVRYRTSPGEGFFNIVNEIGSGYGYPADMTEPWEFVVICFDGGNIREIVDALSSDRVIYRAADPAAFAMLCRRFADQTAADTPLTFFPKLVSMLQQPDEPQRQLTRSFREIVERDVLTNPTIFSIASELGISREYLQREYKKQTGTTPLQYLNNRRYEKLCSLLLTSASEAEIAAMMHFPSISGMSIFFKRMSGMTPSRFRKQRFTTI